MQSEGFQDWTPKSGLDVLLLLLYAPDGDKPKAPIHGITRLDKLMFLLSRFEEFRELFEGDYDFIPYNFGPFATELLDDLEALKSQELIHVNERSPRSASEIRDAEVIDEETGEFADKDVTWDIYKHEAYSLTDLGADVAENLFESATESQREVLKRVKTSFNSKSLTGLLRYVYRTYPTYTTKSVIRSKILDGQ